MKWEGGMRNSEWGSRNAECGKEKNGEIGIRTVEFGMEKRNSEGGKGAKCKVSG